MMALRVGKDPFDYINEVKVEKSRQSPGLAKSLIMAKNNMLQARVVDYDAYRDMAEEFNIRSIPTIIVYDKNWKEIGRFVETPKKFLDFV